MRGITAMALSSGRQRDDAAGLLRRAWPNDLHANTVLKAAVSPDLAPRAIRATRPRRPCRRSRRSPPRCSYSRTACRWISAASPWFAFRTSRLAPQPGFIGEGAAAPVVQFSLAGVDVGPACRILILAAVTGELDRATPETATAIVGRVLAEAVTRAVDSAAFSSNAATAIAPAGLALRRHADHGLRPGGTISNCWRPTSATWPARSATPASPPPTW